MKIIQGIALALVAGALLAAPALRAEDKADQAPGQVWNRADRRGSMKQWLGLSDEQAAQCEKLMDGQREEAKALRDKLKADQAELAVLVDGKASDERLTGALDGIAKDRRALQAQWDKRREALQAILSPLQQAKLALKMGGMGRGRMGGWRGRRGGGGMGACMRMGGKPMGAKPVPMDDTQN